MATSFLYTPRTVDVYEKSNGDQIIIIGETHGEIAGKNLSKLEIYQLLDAVSPSEFIFKKIKENPSFHVYAEIETPPENSGLSNVQANLELDKLRDTKYGKKIHNIDFRLHLLDEFWQEFDECCGSLEFFLSTKPSEKERKYFIKKLKEMEPEIKHNNPDMVEIIKVVNEDEDEDENEDEDEDTFHNSEYEYTHYEMVTPFVEAIMSQIIKNNPDKASDMLFYTGMHHSERLKEQVLTPKKLKKLGLTHIFSSSTQEGLEPHPIKRRLPKEDVPIPEFKVSPREREEIRKILKKLK